MPAEVDGLLSAIVLTKVRAPLSDRGLIRRTALLDRVTDQHNRQITLVHAPAGFGKSTLLMQWAQADSLRRFGWLTLDEAENDPVLLWRYILYAFQTLTPGLANDALRLIDVPNPDLRSVASRLVNALLDIPGRLVLVLDDYQVITNRACHESIQYFIDHMPESAQIALGTRVRPPLALARHTARGQVLEIDSTALRFTIEEARAVLERRFGRVSPAQVARVHHATEGWPIGVSLSRAPHSHASSGGRGLSSYLMEQMLDEFSHEDRQALADWSILGRINGSLADRVSGRADSAVQLEQFSESNLLLTPLDEHRHWYRFHDLLRDELRREFEKRPEDYQRAAHSRAMDWWLEKGGIPEAIHHALEAHQFTLAGEQLCSYWYPYLLSGNLETLQGWLERFPNDRLLAYPPLLVVAGWVAAFSGDVEKTHRFVAAAKKATFSGDMADGTASYESAVALLRASLGQSGMTDASKWAELAYRLEPQESPWRPSAAALAGVTRFGLGRYEEAQAALAEAARFPTGPDAVGVYARGQLALLLMTTGDWEEASRQAELACREIEDWHIGNLLPSGAALVASAAIAAHDGVTGLATQRLDSFARVLGGLSNAIPFDAFQLHLIAGETELAIGNHSGASVHARAASAYLETFGDGGIFERRMHALGEALEASHETVPIPPSNEPELILTDRELEILRLLPADLTLREIGNKLYVSRNTAKTHVAHLYRKLGATDRSSAVTRARQLELI